MSPEIKINASNWGIHMKKFIVVIAATLFATSACSYIDKEQEPENFESAVTPSPAQAKLDELSARVDQAMQEIIALKSSPTTKSEDHSSGILIAGTNEQVPLKSTTGMLTVSLKSIKAAKDGATAEILIGNPQAATISGLKFMLEYGSLNSDGAVNEATKKSREVALTKKLKGGTNTPIKLNLEGLAADPANYLILSGAQYKQLDYRSAQ